MNDMVSGWRVLRSTSWFWRLVVVAGLVPGTAGLLGLFSSFHWVADLLSHFRVQYFLCLAGVALLLLVPGRWKTSALFGALAAINLWMIVPLYLGKTEQPLSSSAPIRIVFANVNTRWGDPERVAEVVGRFRPDVLVLEEVSEAWLAELAPVLSEYPSAVSRPREDNFGILLCSRFPFMQSRILSIGEAGVPSAMAEIETPSGRCTVLATHLCPPTGDRYYRWRNSQLAGLPSFVRQASSPVLLLGDLNVTPWSPFFRRLLRETGLKDSSRGRGPQATWPAFFPLLGIPIDQCLHSPSIAILRREVGSPIGSDHFPVILDVVLPSP